MPIDWSAARGPVASGETAFTPDAGAVGFTVLKSVSQKEATEDESTRGGEQEVDYAGKLTKLRHTTQRGSWPVHRRESILVSNRAHPLVCNRNLLLQPLRTRK
jgi:hypothetical protein